MTPALYSTARLLAEAVRDGNLDDAKVFAASLLTEMAKPLAVQPWTPWNRRGAQ